MVGDVTNMDVRPESPVIVTAGPQTGTLTKAARTVGQFLDLAKQGRIDKRSMLGRLVSFTTWLFRDQCYIRDTNERIVPLRPNAAQILLISSWMVQAATGRPIRSIVLKARKLGASTLIQAFYYYLCKHYRNQIASTLAHQTTSTQEIFDITHRIGKKDPGGSPKQNRTLLFFFPSDSRYSCHTAAAEGVGAGGTPNLLHVSEIALLAESRKIEVRSSAVNAVPNTPTSMIVQESTARGQDSFFALFRSAHDPDHPYEPVFLPWFLDESLEAPSAHKGPLDDGEAQIIATGRAYGLEVTGAQLAWRRLKLDEIGPNLFRQEFPSTPEEAVSARRGLILPGMASCVVSKFPFDYESVNYDERVGGWDHGYRDPTAMASAVYRDQTLHIFDLYRARGELSEQCAVRAFPGHVYYCDPAALAPREELQAECGRIGIDARFVPAPRGRGEKEAIIVDDEWEIVARWIAHGRIKIHVDIADQFLVEADNFETDERTGRPRKTRCPAGNDPDWGHFDTLDMLRYMIMGVLESDTPAVQVRNRTDDWEPSRREMLRA
jgi:hypothetical protein